MGGGVFEWTLPVVVNLTNAQVWLPAIDGPATVCSLPLWSDALQLLISTHRDEVLLFDVNGAVVRRFQGQRPLHLSLSGRRLLAGFVWHDLETGRTVDFSGQHEWPMIAQPAWSSDETRLAEGFLYADANTGDYYEIAPNELYPVGRGGPIGCPGVLSWAHWIRNETRVVIEWDVLQDVEGSQKPIIPLIDPVNRTFEDLCVLASLPADACAIGVIPQVSPDGGYMLAGRYLIDLNTFFTRTLPSDFTFKGWRPDNRLVLLGQDAIFMGWSPDGQFALLGQNLEWETRRGEYAVLSVKDGDIRAVSATPIVAPTWSPSGRHLAFLAEDGRALIALDVNTWSARRAELPQPFVDILWQPEGDSPIALANDGSLWWLPDPEATVVMPLTRPLPGVRDVHWSPDGNHLAFVSGTDIYVVSLRDVESPE